MTFQKHLAAMLQQSLEVLEMTLADFSDADMLVRPVPAANHAAWQLGHLVCSESEMMRAVGAKDVPALPAGLAEKFSAATARVDDPSAFPAKGELLALLKRQRAATIAWVLELKEEDLGRAMPEALRSFIPTFGDCALLTPAHAAMHVGQFQVIRRKLGKPILF